MARGVNASEVFHGSPFSPAGRLSGPDPERQSYRSYVSFEDPDGNAWIVQEVTHRLPGRIDPATMTFASANDLASAMRRAAAAHGEHETRSRRRIATSQPEPPRPRLLAVTRRAPAKLFAVALPRDGERSQRRYPAFGWAAFLP